MYSDKGHNYVYLREEVNCPGRGMKKTSEELKIFFISIWVVTVRVHAYVKLIKLYVQGLYILLFPSIKM